MCPPHGGVRQHEQGDANTRGYHAWSIMDNFAWDEGYSHRLTYVDFRTQERYIKDSGKWYSRLGMTGTLP